MAQRRIFIFLVLLACSLQAAAQNYYPPPAPVNAAPPPAPGSIYGVPGQAMPAPAAYANGMPASAAAPYIQAYPGGAPAPPNYDLPHPAAALPAPDEKLVQSSWYTRTDYFHWNERIGAADFVNESGALYTLGYTHRAGIERYRLELFGGDMNYKGYVDQDDGTTETLPSKTRYLGIRGEYEFVLTPPSWQETSILVGLGNRFWIRDIESGTGDQGNYYSGYQESWWTIYPYLGIESARHMNSSLELYSSSRLGMTAVNYNYAAILDEPLWPRPGFFGQVEIGLRGERFYLAGYCEYMTFSRSRDIQVYDATSPSGFDTAFQPASQMVTVGGKLGFTF